MQSTPTDLARTYTCWFRYRYSRPCTALGRIRLPLMNWTIMPPVQAKMVRLPQRLMRLFILVSGGYWSKTSLRVLDSSLV